MKTTEILAYKREDISKASTKQARLDGFVPGVVYGGKEAVHFTAPAILFRELLYTPDAYFVELNIEGDIKKCIIKEAQFHPVSEILLHVDFYEISDKKAIVMDIPVELEGSAPGVKKGGKLYLKARTVRVKALPPHMPDTMKLDVSGLELGKTIKVVDIEAGELEIITNPQVSVASVQIPRALRQALNEDDAEGEGEEAPSEEAEA
ncbi:MAG: 50S ribosomal protein L25/general stress protein Ctc [Cyclobacteriaceae bacterium]